MEESLSKIIGETIILPDTFEYEIRGIKLDSIDKADFTIITYIDSIGCTPCRLKLDAWTATINKLSLYHDLNINFIMIIDGSKKLSTFAAIKSSRFNLPIVFDNHHLFYQKNTLPQGSNFNTYLLNFDNEIIAVGNPVLNPKILKYYTDLIKRESQIKVEHYMDGDYGLSLGIISPSDIIERQIFITNISDSTLHLTDLIPHCDCVIPKAKNPIVDVNDQLEINIQFRSDSIRGPFKRVVDAYFEEKETPMPIVIYGYNQLNK